MDLNQLIWEASKEIKIESGKMDAALFAEWIVNNCKINDLINVIRQDSMKTIYLKKDYSGKKSIEMLENSNMFTFFAGYMALKGHLTEGKEVFKVVLSLTPNDTSTLNEYGSAILWDIVKIYKKKNQWDRQRIESALKLISKAAMIDKSLHEEPLLQSAYSNLCFLRAFEATYYIQERQFLTGFIVAWMSIEMTVYRVWYTHLKENLFSKQKTSSLERWNIDTIIETLVLCKCDPNFIKLKDDLDMLRGKRNDLLHGKTFEISEGHAKRCVEVALELTGIKQKADKAFFWTKTTAESA